MAHRPNKEFEEFVKRQQRAAAADPPVDWKKERDDWLARLASLYKKLEIFLKRFKEDGSVEISFADVTLNEENIGSYSAHKMIVRIGRQEISLIPVGTSIIGAKGRVDVIGSAGKGRLILVDKDALGPGSVVKVTINDGNAYAARDERKDRQIDWTWKIVSSPPLSASSNSMKSLSMNCLWK